MKIEYNNDVMNYTVQTPDSWDQQAEPGLSLEAAPLSVAAGAFLSADNGEWHHLPFLIPPCFHLSWIFGEPGFDPT